MRSVNPPDFVKLLCISRMDSFFLAEMFKYLYLLFSEKSHLPFEIDDYIFTTEAHLLPVSLSNAQTPCKGNSTVNLTFRCDRDFFVIHLTRQKFGDAQPECFS